MEYPPGRVPVADGGCAERQAGREQELSQRKRGGHGGARRAGTAIEIADVK